MSNEQQQSNPGAGGSNSVADTPITESQGSEKFPQPLRVGQATTSNPTTTPQREKNPKTCERTRLAREQQKKAAAEAAVIIANNKAKKANPDSGVNPTPHGSNSSKNPVANTPTNTEEKNTQGVWGTPTTTQWLAVVSIVVSLIGIYYKREELQAAFSKSGSTPPPKDSNKVDEPQPVRLTVYGKNTPRAKQPRGVKHLD